MITLRNDQNILKIELTFECIKNITLLIKTPSSKEAFLSSLFAKHHSVSLISMIVSSNFDF